MRLSLLQILGIFGLGTLFGIFFFIIRIIAWDKRDKYGYLYKSEGGLLEDPKDKETSNDK